MLEYDDFGFVLWIVSAFVTTLSDLLITFFFKCLYDNWLAIVGGSHSHETG